MKKQYFRMILLIAGLLTVAVILLAPSLRSTFPAKKITSSTASPGKDHAKTIHPSKAPADVVPSSSIHLEDLFPITIEPSSQSKEEKRPFLSNLKAATGHYLKLLFTTIISSNAP
jgi:hypothetical protein